MDVTLIAETVTSPEVLYALTGEEWSIFGDADVLAEFAGRTCYQSYHRPNPATAENKDYHKNVIEQGHFSIYEHSSATFLVTGVSRSFTHELVRHRHLSYSQLSQRFVNESSENRTGFVIPPAFETDTHACEILADAYYFAMDAYEALADHAMGSLGLPRKQAREAARAVLPNMQETKIVVTGNIRAWREVIARRIDPAADAEIQRFARLVLAELRQLAPNSVQDLTDPASEECAE